VLRLVLDTNIVLDWLLFNDTSLDPLRRQPADQRAIILTHEFAITELERVLTYPIFKLTADRQQTLLQRYRDQTQFVAMPEGFSARQLLLPEGFPHCRDADDQPFLALCLHARADALVTKDKALLKLRKRARKYGVTLLDPPAFASRLSSSVTPVDATPV